MTAPARVDGQITLSGDGRVIGRRDGERDRGGRGPGRARRRGVRELGVAGSGALNQFVMDEDFKAQKPPSSGNAGAVTLEPSAGELEPAPRVSLDEAIRQRAARARDADEERERQAE